MAILDVAPPIFSDADSAIPTELGFLRLGAHELFNGRQQSFLLAMPDHPPDSRVPYPPTLYIILKATRLCNLRCSYCNAWREGPNQVLSFEMLAQTIKQAMQLPGIKWLHIVWHGGETTLLSRRYFQRAVWLQEHFRIDSRRVAHSIQTNATRLDEDWCRFFKAADFAVGVSVDFDEESHDRHRRFKDGNGSYSAANAGVGLLRKFGVNHGWLAVVDDRTIALGAKRLLQILVEHGARDVGMLNALPSNDESNSQTSYLPWGRYVEFLRDIFREWALNFQDKVTIREVDSLYRIVRGSRSRLCIYQGECMGQYLTIEPDGRVSACDKYVGDEQFGFGDLHATTLHEMLCSSTSLKRAAADAGNLLRQFKACPNHQYCRGGCPHDARLNFRHGYESNCCGLYDLIEDMKKLSAKEQENG